MTLKRHKSGKLLPPSLQPCTLGPACSSCFFKNLMVELTKWYQMACAQHGPAAAREMLCLMVAEIEDQGAILLVPDGTPEPELPLLLGAVSADIDAAKDFLLELSKSDEFPALIEEVNQTDQALHEAMKHQRAGGRVN